jgi:cytochrome c
VQGKAVYEQKCELCHGKEASGGKNAALVSTKDRTVTNYVPHATTVFDFTRRAMPWPQPKSLTADETYAVTAYLLALAKIIGENDVMNAETLPKCACRTGMASSANIPRSADHAETL